MMQVTCYPSPGKKKGLKICTSFAQGCGGAVAREGEPNLAPGAAFFYGWTEYTWPLMARCVREGRVWFYADNAYYYGRGSYFRVTRCALMHDGRHGARNDKLLDLYGVRGAPCRKTGAHIVVTPQSQGFYTLRMGITRDVWTAKVVETLRCFTRREIVVCDKADRRGGGRPHVNFGGALPGAWAVVGPSGSTMVKAVADGHPVFSLGPSMGSAMGSDDLSRIEDPCLPDEEDRAAWLSQILAQQWTYGEMISGACWRGLKSQQSSSLDLARSVVT